MEDDGTQCPPNIPLVVVVFGVFGTLPEYKSRTFDKSGKDPDFDNQSIFERSSMSLLLSSSLENKLVVESGAGPVQVKSFNKSSSKSGRRLDIADKPSSSVNFEVKFENNDFITSFSCLAGFTRLNGSFVVDGRTMFVLEEVAFISIGFGPTRTLVCSVLESLVLSLLLVP